MKRTGKKITNSHTTIIEAASVLVDFAHDNVLVDKITLGLIKSLPSSRGINRRIKCTREPACLFVKVRGNRAIQEIRFFSNEIVNFEKELKRYAQMHDFEIS